MNPNALSELEQSRYFMVEQQIRPWQVFDHTTLQSLFDVPRERYVPPSMQALAFCDVEIPLVIDGVETTESMLCPKIEARLAQELLLKPSDSVLEIGMGSGYLAALIANMAQQVTAVEIDSRIAAFGQKNLQDNNISNVKVEIGDGHAGWGTTEYDAILLTGSVPEIPNELKYQLAVGGRLLAVVGQHHVMTAIRITRTSAASFETEHVFDTVIKPLRGTTVSQFKF